MLLTLSLYFSEEEGVFLLDQQKRKANNYLMLQSSAGKDSSECQSDALSEADSPASSVESGQCSCSHGQVCDVHEGKQLYEVYEARAKEVSDNFEKSPSHDSSVSSFSEQRGKRSREMSDSDDVAESGDMWQKKNLPNNDDVDGCSKNVSNDNVLPSVSLRDMLLREETDKFVTSPNNVGDCIGVKRKRSESSGKVSESLPLLKGILEGRVQMKNTGMKIKAESVESPGTELSSQDSVLIETASFSSGLSDIAGGEYRSDMNSDYHNMAGDRSCGYYTDVSSDFGHSLTGDEPRVMDSDYSSDVYEGSLSLSSDLSCPPHGKLGYEDTASNSSYSQMTSPGRVQESTLSSSSSSSSSLSSSPSTTSSSSSPSSSSSSSSSSLSPSSSSSSSSLSSSSSTTSSSSSSSSSSSPSTSSSSSSSSSSSPSTTSSSSSSSSSSLIYTGH